MSNKYSIIFFDDVCTFCNKFVQFVILHDKKINFYFCSLNSKEADFLLKDFSFSKDSILLLQNDKLFKESTAVLQILKKLDGLYPILYSLIIIPKVMRNYLYRVFSKRRYLFFGKASGCILPDAKTIKRFIS